MAKSCLFSPVDKNKKSYKALSKYKKELGQETGSLAFLKALSPTFQERNKGRLDIDDQGVATYETAIKIKSMQDLIGFQNLKNKLEKENGFTVFSNTADNYRMLVNQAKAFNDSNDSFIAYVEKTDNGIQNVIHRKTEDSINRFNDQYGSMLFNDRLVSIFSPLGLKISDLTDAEGGYSGMVDFSKARAIAGEFVDLIKISNNMQGQQSMSEEFSHLIIRMLRDKPFIQRIMTALSQNPEEMRKVLGDSYELYVQQYTDNEGNIDYAPIAEECVGRLLQTSLKENILEEAKNDGYLMNLWKRVYNYIKSIFRDYNYTDIEQAVLDANQTMGTLAKNLLKGAIEFTREDIEKVLPEAQNEMQEIKERAIADGTFMKAPNGKPTNLNERQWLQVRTKAFKEWFGDWEKVARSSKYKKSEDIPNSLTSATYQGVSVSEAKFDPDMAPDGGTRIISIGDKYIGEFPVMEYDDKIKLAGSVGAATEIEKEYRGKGYGTKAYIALANIAKADGKTLYSDTSMTDAALRLWESLVKKGYAEKIEENKGKYSGFNITQYRIINDALPEADTINYGDENISKVVDENGEPLVVYHGTDNNKFTVFNKNKTGKKWKQSTRYNRPAFFFEATNEQALEWGETTIPVYLNIKNPTLASSKYDSLNPGSDGVFSKYGPEYDEIVVFNPNQIKSATYNNGEFSTENDDIMYHLEKEFDELDKIIEDRINVETKKTKIIKNEKAVEAANKKVDNLNAMLKGTPEGKLKGLINYAHDAVYDLGAARGSLEKSKSGEKNFAMLRGIRATIQSYDDFIHQISSLINADNSELAKLVEETSIEDKHHTVVKMKQAYDDLTSVYDLVRDDFAKILLDSVEEFFKPFFNVDGGKFVDGSGKERSLRELIQEANGDIGFTDRYLMTMSASGDLLLQLFEAVVSKAKADARYKTIDDLNEIIRIMLNAEEKGITTFNWVYERDRNGRKTGNYISAVNTGQYERDKEEFLRQLEDEYGINPSGEKAKEKRTRKKEWLSTHGKYHGTKPNEDMYRNSEFDNLSEAQKEVLGEIIKLKQKFDKRLPSNKVAITKAIQMRRTSQQRLLDSLSNPMQAFNNIQESIAKEFTLTNDDDQIYGIKTGLRSFDGSEFKVLPALYTTRLSDPDELTDDIFSALAAYSYSTNVYHEMDKVVDPLEMAKAWVIENRAVKEMSNGKELVEKVNGIVNPILKKGGSNIVAKLEDFMDSQVYLRYYADSDKTINVMGKELKAGKIVNSWLSISSAVQLGFNVLSQLGNLATGVSMQNIEAFCGHYFNAKELFNADAQYLKEIPVFLSEVEAKNQKGKLALFDQLFDIKQEFADNTKKRMNTLFEKLFGKTVAYLGQTCGDHWLYNRTAIAMCLKKKVILADGTETSLWNALKVVDAFEGDSRIKKLAIDAVDPETGQVIDLDYIHEFSDKINKINHRLFGVYNTDDMVAAQRVALGRAMLQYRQWMVPMFARRFQAREYNLSLGEYEEGYYRTLLRVVAGLRGGMHGVMEVWDELDEAGKRNVYRSLIEMSQFMLIWAIANFMQFGNGDPKRSQAMKLAEYMAQRELHELGNLTPSFTMGNEILKTVKSPATILNTTQAAMNLAASLLDPRDWNDEIESGKYEGMSTLHKNILKAPFPILAPFNQLDRFTDSLEEVTRYYARPN